MDSKDMQKNVNTKQYWDKRFRTSWGKAGRKQTEEYAKANIRAMNIEYDFNGSILDFGCGLGDSIPIYKNVFPKAKISGVDISDIAITVAKKKYKNLADFTKASFKDIKKNYDIIIASHVLEHLNNDKQIVSELIKFCKDLFIFVPYMESPLYFEHVNYYDETYYNQFQIVKCKKFTVSFNQIITTRQKIKRLISLDFNFYYPFSKNVIMFHIKGLLDSL